MNSAQFRILKGNGPNGATEKNVIPALHRPGGISQEQGELAMQRESKSRRMEAVRARPVAELLECPASVEQLLNGSAQRLQFRAGEVVFHQGDRCRGLYLTSAGRFARHAVWNQTAELLAPARAGELLELAAVLGDGQHQTTLTAQTAASVLLLPIEDLNRAFQLYAPLRMRLLEEMARMVSRAYYNCCLCRSQGMRRVRTAA